MKKFFYLILFLLICSACSNNSEVNRIEKITNENSLEMYSTPDESVTFRIYNQGNFTSQKLKQLQDELFSSYEKLNNLMDINYEHPDTINIYLYNGMGRSSSTKTDIILYDFDRNLHALTHELHTFCLALATNPPTNMVHLLKKG
ncbi:hypothetical protein [Cytobacillus gottheilii]|uniref:hypothetical protein n=1 Tax=Cytobacillus gottheilii TaxID=859144 RepID=UPI0009BB25DD|nr:hypothetical protein [Cytobacillus gottheilii]